MRAAAPKRAHVAGGDPPCACSRCAQKPTWLDYFIMVNLIFMVLVNLMSLFIVVYEKNEDKNMQHWANACDIAIKRTMPAGVVLMNTGLFMLGLYGEADQLLFMPWIAMGAQSAAIDCILGQDPQVWTPHGEPPLESVLAWADIAPEPSRVV